MFFKEYQGKLYCSILFDFFKNEGYNEKNLKRRDFYMILVLIPIILGVILAVCAFFITVKTAAIIVGVTGAILILVPIAIIVFVAIGLRIDP